MRTSKQRTGTGAIRRCDVASKDHSCCPVLYCTAFCVKSPIRVGCRLARLNFDPSILVSERFDRAALWLLYNTYNGALRMGFEEESDQPSEAQRLGFPNRGSRVRRSGHDPYARSHYRRRTAMASDWGRFLGSVACDSRASGGRDQWRRSHPYHLGAGS